MGIEIQSGPSAAVVGLAAYAGGKNRWDREREESNRRLLQLAAQARYATAYQSQAFGQRKQLLGMQMVWPQQETTPAMLPDDRVKRNAQIKANDRARRQGKQLPFPELEPAPPLPARVVIGRERQAAENAREQDRQNAAAARNQANINAANKRAAEAEVGRNDRAKQAEEGKDRREGAKAPMPDPALEPAEVDPLKPKGGVDIPGKPLGDPSRDKVSMDVYSGGYGQTPLAATGLGGSVPASTPDFLGQYHATLADLNRQLAQQQSQSYLQAEPEQPALQDSPYYQQSSAYQNTSAYYG